MEVDADASEKTPRTSLLKVGERRPAGEADDKAEAVEPYISHSSREDGGAQLGGSRRGGP
jgi:hypothetical protein